MKFILTKELGRLATWLRILGYDADFYRQDNLSTLIITALRQERIILTRNTRMAKYAGPRIVRIESDFVGQQIKQVMANLKLKPQPKDMFTRCVICNIELEDIAKKCVRNKVPEHVYQTQKNFLHCPRCKKIYWQGTHWGNARKYLNDAICS